MQLDIPTHPFPHTSSYTSIPSHTPLHARPSPTGVGHPDDDRKALIADRVPAAHPLIQPIHQMALSPPVHPAHADHARLLAAAAAAAGREYVFPQGLPHRRRSAALQAVLGKYLDVSRSGKYRLSDPEEGVPEDALQHGWHLLREASPIYTP